MTQLFKLFLLVIMLNPLILLFGQQPETPNSHKRLKISDIDKICNSIKENKTLRESIKEGETVDKKDGFDTYYLQGQHNQLVYRITHTFRTDSSYYNSIFYYNNKKVIKAIIKTMDNELTKKSSPTIYYFDNNKVIGKFGEDIGNVTYKDILKQGLDFQEQYYNDKRTLKNGVQQ